MPEHSILAQILDAVPDIDELTSYAKTDKWRELGIQQKLDKVNQKGCNSCAELYGLWLEEKGKYATRRMFLAALRDIKQNMTANYYVNYLKTIKMVSDIVKDNLDNIFVKLHY